MKTGRIRAEIERGRNATAAIGVVTPGVGALSERAELGALRRRSPLLDGLLEEWYLDLRQARRRPDTLRSYREPWSLFLRRTGIQTLDQLDASTVKAYLLSLSEVHGNRDATVMDRFRAIRAFVSWCLDQDDLEVHPSLVSRHRHRGWFRVQTPKVDEEEPDPYTHAQIHALEAYCRRYQGTKFERRNEVAQRYLVLFHLLWGTGVRLGEALRLELEDLREIDPVRLEDVGHAHAYIHVRSTKKHQDRKLPITDRLHRELLRYLRHRPQSITRNMFLTDAGTPLRIKAVEHFLFNAGQRLGFRAYAHRFRHTFATDFLREHPNEIETLRKLLGHKDYVMVQRYVHLRIEDLARNWQESAPY